MAARGAGVEAESELALVSFHGGVSVLGPGGVAGSGLVTCKCVVGLSKQRRSCNGLSVCREEKYVG